jgi:hypothetical protein
LQKLRYKLFLIPGKLTRPQIALSLDSDPHRRQRPSQRISSPGSPS